MMMMQCHATGTSPLLSSGPAVGVLTCWHFCCCLPLQKTFHNISAAVQQLINFCVWLFNSMWAAVQYIIDTALDALAPGKGSRRPTAGIGAQHTAWYLLFACACSLFCDDAELIAPWRWNSNSAHTPSPTERTPGTVTVVQAVQAPDGLAPAELNSVLAVTISVVTEPQYGCIHTQCAISCTRMMRRIAHGVPGAGQAVPPAITPPAASAQAPGGKPASTEPQPVKHGKGPASAVMGLHAQWLQQPAHE